MPIGGGRGTPSTRSPKKDNSKMSLIKEEGTGQKNKPMRGGKKKKKAKKTTKRLFRTTH